MNRRLLYSVVVTLFLGGCKDTVDEKNPRTSNSEHASLSTENTEQGTIPDVLFALYENRVFQFQKEYKGAKIDFSMIGGLKPWDEDLLMKLFEPIVGTNIVYKYKTKYSIPKNIDETEGDYDEYLIVEVDSQGQVVGSLLYEGGPKQGPVFSYLYRGGNCDITIESLSDISQLNLHGTFCDLQEDGRHLRAAIKK